MSWHYLQGQEEASSEDICWDGERFVPSNGQTTLVGYCLPDSETESCHDSPSGTMCRPSTGSRGEDELMSSAADSLAKIFPVLERARESLAKDRGCGHTWRGSSVKLNPSGSWLKTALSLLPEDSMPFCGTWPKWGTMRNGECWERLTPERPTNATGSGLWPTPTVTGNHNRKGASKNSGDGLATAVKWATPTCHDRKGKSGAKRGRNAHGSECLTQQAGGTLNPLWVEWLMGWPIGWTDCEPLETDKFQQWLRSHGAC